MSKPLALDVVRSRAGAFARRWADSPGDERQEAQSFVRDLLGVYGITDTRAALYEYRAKRSSTARVGYIDALIPGLAVVEMKSAGKHLATAEAQAMDYLDDLTDAEFPRYILTSDFHHFRIRDLTPPEGADPANAVVEFDLVAFPANAERLSFFAGYHLDDATAAEKEAASIKAAQIMASLYEGLEGSGFDDHEASVFLVRILFCLYADTAGVWERDLFLHYLQVRTADDGTDLGPMLARLFKVLATPLDERQSNLAELAARFPYVNGGIFDHHVSLPEFTAEMRRRLLDACLFNWSIISPAVFGSLFQAVKSKEARRELGEHYTTSENILKLIGPMFLDGLHARFKAARNDAAKLRALRRDLGSMRFLDPAAGCGNFLVIAYREMRALELAILQRLIDLQGAGKGGKTAATSFAQSLFRADAIAGEADSSDVVVKLEHFHGIEIDDWPAAIAATALHLVEHQANQAMEDALGFGPATLPLDKVTTITVGNALRLDWTAIVPPSEHLYILGNPPFLGHATRTPEQAQELRDAWQREDIGRLDYVTGWYAKTLDVFTRSGYAGEFAFVSTNSITQGEPVPALFGPVFDAGWRIKFAHRTFAWTSEAPGAAAVHCTILGFERATPRPAPARIWDYGPDIKGEGTETKVSRLNGYLVEAPDVLVEQQRKPLCSSLPAMMFGNMPRDDGNLIVEPADYDDVMADPIAAKYLRPFIGARQLIHNEPRWCLWLTDLAPADALRSPILKSRLEACASFRAKSSAASTRQMAQTPHLFGQRSQPTTNYVCVPRHVSENRRFFPVAHFTPDVICGDSNFEAPDPDGFAFAVISSSSFITWQRAVGGRIKSDLRFSNTLTWNTFPLAAVTDTQRAAIIAAGQAVLDARALHPDRSLADHYNPLAMAPELLASHRTLDRTVDAVFGLRSPTDADRLSALFASYERMTTTDTLKLPKPSARSKPRQQS
ncbi:MAG: class I SAM-dependent DNA methyltransferase [Micrococcales bacterium]|nr:class I SAM-dependent DNA methyltransferase [Micrococcales bacterium]